MLLYPLGVLAPVPTAVPPKATFSSSFFADTIPSRAIVNAVVYDANSLHKVTGSASIR